MYFVCVFLVLQRNVTGGGRIVAGGQIAADIGVRRFKTGLAYV